ncbi:MAG: PQQ-binding-like beta-propeller repeat protein [Planctomycetota bacterium]
MDKVEAPSEEINSVTTLRWWPAVLLLVLMAAMRSLSVFIDTPSMGVMMLSLMGPAAIGLLILTWWLLASHASVREKAVGSVGFALVTAIGLAFLHPSLKGMPAIIYVIPTAFATFAMVLALLAKYASWRVPAAILVTAFGVGYWDARQSEGFSGSLEPHWLWRWQPNSEQVYLRQLASQVSQPSLQVAEEELALTSSPWPAFRGRNRDGVVSGIVIDEDWDTSPPKLVWRRKIGPGWSSFSVAGDLLYTQEQRGDQEAVLCLSAETGDNIWDTSYPSRFWEALAGAGPRATPTVAKEGLFTLGGAGILLCLDPWTGREIWRRDIKLDADRDPPMWGFASSPLVTDGLVMIHAGGTDQKGVLAYRVSDGELVWSAPSGNHSYSSAQTATFDDQHGVLMVSNQGLQFVNVNDGTTIWEYAWPNENYRVLQPLVSGSSILIASSLNEGTRRISVERASNGTWDLKEQWTSLGMKPSHNDFVHYQGAIYGFDNNIFGCIDFESGDRNWKRGRYGCGQILLLEDSGQLLVTTEKGEIVLIQASAERLDERAKLQAIDGKTWTHSVLLGDRFFVRNASEAACYEMPVREIAIANSESAPTADGVIDAKIE